MLLWLFVVFFGIGLILTIAGFAVDVPILNLVGTIMIFLLGMGLLDEGLTYKTGEVELYQYGNNFTGYHWDYDAGTAPTTTNPNDVGAYLFHKNITGIYDYYDDSSEDRFGWLLMAMGALGFSLSLFRL